MRYRFFAGAAMMRVISWLLVLAVLGAFLLTSKRGLQPLEMQGSASSAHFSAATPAGNVDLSATMARIRAGRHYPHRNDGAVFQNRERRLPSQAEGFYHEYVNPTSSGNGPGAQRIIVGQGGELYYTPDHYDHFYPITENAR
jgi:guanyl-specific ribonuclease Sa